MTVEAHRVSIWSLPEKPVTMTISSDDPRADRVERIELNGRVFLGPDEDKGLT